MAQDRRDDAVQGFAGDFVLTADADGLGVSLCKSDGTVIVSLNLYAKIDIVMQPTDDSTLAVTTGQYIIATNASILGNLYEVVGVGTTITSTSGLGGAQFLPVIDLRGKQDVISDIATIRSNAEAGATALQPSALNPSANSIPLREGDGFADSNITDNGTQVQIGTINSNKNLAVKGGIFINPAPGTSPGNVLSVTETENTGPWLGTLTRGSGDDITHGSTLLSDVNTNTQLTASTILAVLNGASGNIDADLLSLASGGNNIVFQPTDGSVTLTIEEGDLVIASLPSLFGNWYTIGANPPTLTSVSNFANAAFVLSYTNTDLKADSVSVNPVTRAITGPGGSIVIPMQAGEAIAFVPSDHDVTEFADVTNAGSGAIITDAERTTLGSALQAGDINVDAIHVGDYVAPLAEAFVVGPFNLDTDHIQVNDINSNSFADSVREGEKMQIALTDGSFADFTIVSLNTSFSGSTLVTFTGELPNNIMSGEAILVNQSIVKSLVNTSTIHPSVNDVGEAGNDLQTTVVGGVITEIGGVPVGGSSGTSGTTFISSQAEADAIARSATDGQFITVEGGSYQVDVFHQLQYAATNTDGLTILGPPFLDTDVYLVEFDPGAGTILGTGAVFDLTTEHYNIQINYDNVPGEPNADAGRSGLVSNGVAVNLNNAGIEIAVRQEPTDQWVAAGLSLSSQPNSHEGRIRIDLSNASTAAFGTGVELLQPGACLGVVEKVTLADGLSYVWNQTQGRFDPVTPSTRTVSELPGGTGGQTSTPSYDDNVLVQNGDIVFLQGALGIVFSKDTVPTGLWRYRFISQAIQGWVAIGKDSQYNSNIIYAVGEPVFNDVNGAETPFRAISYRNDWTATAFQPAEVVSFLGEDGTLPPADVTYYRWDGTNPSTATQVPGVDPLWVLTFRPFAFGIEPGVDARWQSYWTRLNPYVGELLEEVEDGIRVENRSGNGDAFTGTREVIDLFNDPSNNNTPTWWRFTEGEDEQDPSKIASLVDVIATTNNFINNFSIANDIVDDSDVFGAGVDVLRLDANGSSIFAFVANRHIELSGLQFVGAGTLLPFAEGIDFTITGTVEGQSLGRITDLPGGEEGYRIAIPTAELPAGFPTGTPGDEGAVNYSKEQLQLRHSKINILDVEAYISNFRIATRDWVEAQGFGSGGGGGLTASTILAVLNAATGSIDADLLGNAGSGNALTAATILAVINAASGSIDGDLLGNAPNDNTQLTATTILAILNGASGSIDADLLANAPSGTTPTQLPNTGFGVAASANAAINIESSTNPFSMILATGDGAQFEPTMIFIERDASPDVNSLFSIQGRGNNSDGTQTVFTTIRGHLLDADPMNERGYLGFKAAEGATIAGNVTEDIVRIGSLNATDVGLEIRRGGVTYPDGSRQTTASSGLGGGGSTLPTETMSITGADQQIVVGLQNVIGFGSTVPGIDTPANDFILPNATTTGQVTTVFNLSGNNHVVRYTVNDTGSFDVQARTVVYDDAYLHIIWTGTGYLITDISQRAGGNIHLAANTTITLSDGTVIADAGDLGANSGDIITLNFARIGRLTDNDAPRSYCTIIEPTGTGTGTNLTNWQIVQNFRSTDAEGTDVNGKPVVMTRTYTFTDLTADQAYINRDTIRVQRANAAFDATQLPGYSTGLSTYTTK